ncbi:MAG: YceI family protein [Candidatus Methylumidiphilus sp.]
MSKPYAHLAALLCLSLAGSAYADSYTIDARHTFPSFEVSHVGFSTQRGRFDRTSGTIHLDAKAHSGAIDIEIAADSIDTGLTELEDKLKSAEFFDTAQFPSIQFKADTLEFKGDAPVAADGTLTLHGVSKPLRLNIGHFHCGIHPANKRNVCGADASGQIKRSDFGLKAFLPAVGDDVKILIQVEAFKD